MKISFALPLLNLSGGNKVVFDYARTLIAAGHTVTVVHPPLAQPTLKQRAKSLAKRLIYPGYGDRGLAHGQDSGVPVRRGKTPGRLEAEDFPDADIVVATWWETGEWIDPLPPAKGKKVHLVQDHEIFPNQPGDRVRAIYAKPWPKIAVSRWLAAVCEAEYPQGACLCVPNGVELDHFGGAARIMNAAPRVGMVWSASERKNSAMGLEALLLAKARLPDLEVVMFGSIPPPLKIGRLGWIAYHHQPPQDRIPSLYSACDAWLFSSISEGFGLPLLEAMAMHTPVVATRAGAAPDLVDGVNGVLVDCAPQAMADGLVQLLTEPPQDWERRSRAARRTAQANDFADAAKRFEGALRSILAS